MALALVEYALTAIKSGVTNTSHSPEGAAGSQIEPAANVAEACSLIPQALGSRCGLFHQR
jgi:hypothetical protein